MTADFVLSLSRKIEDKAANTARAHVIKNRFGIDGITYPCSMNTHTGLINVHRPSSKMGVESSKKMRSAEDFLQQSARNAYRVLGPNANKGSEEKTSDKNLDGFE
jgi:hypothetical protein